jgi:hypothetical protein
LTPGRGYDETGGILEGGPEKPLLALSITGGAGTELAVTVRSPLYFFQQVAQRHSIARAPLGNFRRVRRQPNDLLMRV